MGGGVSNGLDGGVSGDEGSTEAVRIDAVCGASELLAIGEYVFVLNEPSECSASVEASSATGDDIIPLSLDRKYSRLEDMLRFPFDTTLLA